ncbi:flavodoxin [Actinotignum urinale]|uniref:Flavodoxin n=1 Tax=Actinotignum urinale TaxID=190146 RepID=A0AAW9HS82_9ACTO|nr:flavodoxin [Actinotignum urinale]MDY5133179.1 flavodoxin [Actinotignum urinale]MDY5151149.1 flavodoxin [Actinotignum urinale]MDY5155492.1 flavodoxin [Actinotignum urinale]MDY5160480.1 flavodoxin [Actinotignum urinale]WIK59634.1 flavodoxin [Actinotignum urinale]
MCHENNSESQAGLSHPKTLVAYFSRPGLNMWYDDEKYMLVGQTQVLATRIARKLGADTFAIEPILTYPGNVENCKNRHNLELVANLYPPFTRDVPDLEGYDVILIGFPLWLTTVPRIVQNFIRKADIGERLILPFYTYSIEPDGILEPIFNDLAPEATLGTPLTLRGETLDDLENDEKIQEWLTSAGLKPIF